MIIPVDLNNGKYNIYIKKNVYDELANDLAKRKSRVFVVADKTAYKYHGKAFFKTIGIEPAGIFFVQGEKSKSISVLEQILEKAASVGITRSDCMVAFGGGVCGDITGFAAAVYMRGIDFYQVPTTLLAQVDSSVGGKTGVDLDAGKNLAGAFHQPLGVYINTDVLSTLREAEICQGKAEMIKAAAIYDEKLFCEFENKMVIDGKTIGRCVEIKLEYVSGDELDNGKRMMLNFGHTIAHGIENTLGYDKISHGDAVSIGMAYSTRISESIGISKKGTAIRMENLLKSQNMPINTDILPSSIIDSMKKDKKIAKGKLNAVFLEKIGASIVKQMTIDEFAKLGIGIWM